MNAELQRELKVFLVHNMVPLWLLLGFLIISLSSSKRGKLIGYKYLALCFDDLTNILSRTR